MRRKPRSATAGIFADGMGGDIAYQGLLVAALVLLSYFMGHYFETGNWAMTNSADGTTMAFLTMSMAEIFHSLNMRSLRGNVFKLGSNNWGLYGAAAGTLLLTTLVCEVPLLANAFGFTPISAEEYFVAIAIGIIGFFVVEIVKFFQRKAMAAKTL